MASLRYALAICTKAENALKKTTSDADMTLAKFKTAPMELLKHGYEEIRATISILTRKLDHLDVTCNKLMNVADESNVVEEEERKCEAKIETVTMEMDKARDIIDQLKALVEAKSARNDDEQRIKEKAVIQQNEDRNRRTQQICNWATMEIRKFGEETVKWANVWSIFDERVNQDEGLTKMMKFSMLLSSLHGQPKDMVERFQTLYGNSDDTIAELTNQLRQIESRGVGIVEQRRLFDKLLVITMTLQSLGEVIDTWMHKKMITNKFNRKIRVMVYRRKVDLRDGLRWTMEKLMSDLEEIIAREEIVEKLMRNLESGDNRQQNRMPTFKKNFERQQMDQKTNGSEKNRFENSRKKTVRRLYPNN